MPGTGAARVGPRRLVRLCSNGRPTQRSQAAWMRYWRRLCAQRGRIDCGSISGRRMSALQMALGAVRRQQQRLFRGDGPVSDSMWDSMLSHGQRLSGQTCKG